MQATLPQLTRSALQRCLPRHGIDRLPEMAGDQPAKKQGKPSPRGYIPIDIAEVRTEEGQLSLFVAMDRTCKFADAELHEEAHKMVAAQVLRHVGAAVPDTIHTVLPDHGMQFPTRQRDLYAFPHIFERVCPEFGIEPRLPTTTHPWTNGQVERMNRPLEDATVKKYHDQTQHPLKRHLQAFRMAYTFAKRLKTLQGLTPYESSCQCWQKDPERFTTNPYQPTLGLNTAIVRVCRYWACLHLS